MSVLHGIAAYWRIGAMCVCCCFVSDRICVRAGIVLSGRLGLYVTLVFVTRLRVLSVETCACVRACTRAGLVRLVLIL